MNILGQNITPHETLYDFKVMKCIDPDNLVFAEQVSDDIWTFCQITNLSLLRIYNGCPEKFTHDVYVNERVSEELRHSYSITSFSVDLSNESEKYVERLKNKFYKNNHKDWKFLSCEHIFHEDAAEDIINNILIQNPHYYD